MICRCTPFGGIRVTYFSVPPVDERLIEQMFQRSLEALRTTREHVFDIAEAVWEEQNRLLQLLEQVKEETERCIELVDRLEAESRAARELLAKINRNFASFTEDEIREAYAVAERRMVELGAAREREKAVRQRRDDLERQLRHIRQVQAKADHVVSQVGVALDFLTGNVESLAQNVRGMRLQAVIAREVIRAQEEERKRVARDIHDGPAQLLANMAVRVDLLERIARKQPEQLRRELRGMRDVVKTSLADLRRIIFNLRPMALDELGLVPTLCSYVDVVREQFGFNVEFSVLGVPRRLSPTVEITLFRVAQEAVNNAQRHSRGQRAVVRLEFGAAGVRLTVEDDGVGFNPEQLPDDLMKGDHGFGLLHMRERLRLLRGEFRIVSAPGQGTKVTALVPWDVAVDEAGDESAAAVEWAEGASAAMEREKEAAEPPAESARSRADAASERDGDQEEMRRER